MVNGGWLALSALLLSVILSCTAGGADRERVSAPVFVYASLAGQPTIDRDAEGGNPFATAFIQLLSLKSMPFSAFAADLAARTRRASDGVQQVEIVGGGHLSRWQFLPRPQNEVSIALVIVFSSYARSDIGPSLPGAKRDLSRVADALGRAGFVVTRLADPNQHTLAQAIKQFRRNSTQADVALIYTTGHGIEVNGVPRVLLPYMRTNGHNELPVTELAESALARHANFIIYAACRNQIPPITKRR